MKALKGTRRLALAALLVALMMILGYIESLIPTGSIPGIKLGLSNSVLLLSLYWLGVPVSFELMIVKVLLSGFLFGSPTTMMYAFAGGLLSMIVMTLLIYVARGVSPIGAGIAGGVMHNVGQVGLAMIILETDKLVYYMAILMVVGAVTGAATGTAAKLMMKHLRFELAPSLRDKGGTVSK